MPVSKEELEKDLDTPEYLTLVKEKLAKKEMIVQDKAEHQLYLDRYKSDVIEKEIPTRIKAVHDQYDKDIKETFGIDREASEKTYDYLKRAGKTATGEVQKSADRIKELEDLIKKGDGSKAMAEKLEQEEARFKKLIKEKDQELLTYKQKSEIVSKTADIKLIYGDIKKTFVKTLPPMFSRAEAAALDEAIRLSVVKDGKLYMANGDGSIRKDSSYNEISVEDFLKAEFKEVIEEKKKQGGAGSNGGDPDPIDPTKYDDKTFPMKDDLKTKAALTDYMLSLGIKQGTDQFRLIWKKYGLPLPQ